MTNTLKTLTAALATAHAELQKRQQAISEATRKRDALAAELAGLDAAVEGAEIDHAATLAAIELGEKADTKATAAALEEARRAQAKAPELRQQHRVLDALVAGLERRYLEAHAKAEEANAQHRAALVAELEHRAAATLEDARALVDSLAGRGAELAALRGLLAELRQPWEHGGIVITESLLNPAAVAVEAVKQSIRSELTTA